MDSLDDLYRLLAGPGVWLAFSILIGGLGIRLISLFLLSRKKDSVFYNHIDFGWGLKSVLHWIIPWASTSMRMQPFFTLIGFVFHLTLLSVPVFLSAHIILWDEAFGINWWALPDAVADAMTISLIVAGGLLIGRRIKRPEVRVITGAWDYVLILLTVLPFLTGFLAYHQWGPYLPIITLHVLTGEILMVLIPFTKLGHMVLFFFTRAFIGFEMGGRRGARTW